ncbi:MAG: 16S rRNA (cytosine(967)-C(5))-methyltransferase RsmB [Firmicutes bacterium]|nr:16S rRNA (cytosine(967)-C(5))-methyltransferase RsmB [Bacillota bacterium]
MKEREIALYAIIDILNEKAYNNIVLRSVLARNSHLSMVQRAFVTELVNGTLRNMINIDYIISLYSKTALEKMKPLIINNLRISVYQIMYMDKVPDSAACNEAVELAKQKGFATLAGFVNGVLRNIARNKDNISYPDKQKHPVDYISVKYSYPVWIIEYWLKELDIDTIEKICLSNRVPPKVSACINTLKIDKAGLKKALSADNIAMTDGVFKENALYLSKTRDITQTRTFADGLFHVMDESSMLAVDILAPKPGDKVLDSCAAPGGKSFYCAYKMKNEGEIISADIYEHKLELIRSGAERLGIGIIKPVLSDASVHNAAYDGKMDCVLADAPCSGFGLFRKKPDIKYNKTMEDVEALAKLQRDILGTCQAYVKQGGCLVYSTCTISLKENLENVKWFCDTYGFEPEDISKYLNFECATAKDGYIQVLPCDFMTDGFFIARFVKR